MVVHYAEAEAAVIPLVIGFTAWRGDGWDPALMPFGAAGAACSALSASCFLHDPLAKGESAHVLAFRRRARAVIERIEVRNDRRKAGWPNLSALTVERASGTAGLVPFFRAGQGGATRLRMLGHEELADAAAIAGRLETLQRSLCTFADDLPRSVSVEAPAGYDGPRLRFLGGRRRERRLLLGLCERTAPVPNLFYRGPARRLSFGPPRQRTFRHSCIHPGAQDRLQGRPRRSTKSGL